MPVYIYKALDVHSAAVGGILMANTPYEARAELRQRGLKVISVTEQTHGRVGGLFFRSSARQYATKLVGVMNELVTLLGTGIPLLDSLKSVSCQQPRRIRLALTRLQDRVAQGASLADAMSEQPEMFELLCVRMTEVGENTGTLDSTLRHWAEYKERSLLFRDRVTTALIYPVFVTVVGVFVTVFLMTFVLPMLLDSLLESGKTLPLPTRIAKWTSDLLVHYGLEIFAGLLLSVTGVVLFVRTTRGKRLWHKFLLKLPVFGELTRKQAVSRVAFLIATLTKSGVPFLQGLELASKSAENQILRDALTEAADAVRSGRDIAPALEKTNVFPMSVIQVFSVGQASGHLDEMLERLASDYDRQVARSTERLTAVLEPVLILVLAFFVGFILFATLLPILEAGNVL